MSARLNQYGLTARMTQAMLFVQKEFDRTGRLPSAGRLVGALGLSSHQAAYGTLLKLEKAGYIWRSPSGVGVVGPRGVRRPAKILRRVEEPSEAARTTEKAQSLTSEQLTQALASALAAIKDFALAADSIGKDERDDDVAIITGRHKPTNAAYRKARAIRNALLVTLYAKDRISRESEEDIARRESAKRLLEKEGANDPWWKNPPKFP